MKKYLNNKGITLIALVITIVVLIILAAVAINLTLGNNGIFNRAREAKEKYQNAQDYEETEIAKYSNEIETNVNGSNREIEYVIPFVDVTNVIAQVADDNSWNSPSCNYTATTDCYIMGYIQLYNYGTVEIKINNVIVSRLYNTDTTWDVSMPINYLIKSGDSISFTASGGNLKKINAYGLRY